MGGDVTGESTSNDAPAVPPDDVGAVGATAEAVPAVREASATTDAAGVTADLWAFTFREPLLAQEALMAAMRLQSHERLRLDDAAIVVKDDRGKVRIVQTKDVSAGRGALSGSWWGLLAGLFVPGGPLIGMALGAAAGGLFGKLRDIGIKDDEMREWGDRLDDGQAALFLLVEDCHQLRALHEVSRFEARVLTSTAPPGLVAQVADRLAVSPWDS